MVARGDLGIEMRLSQVPGTQKTIIRKCIQAAKPVITATQMLESMMTNARPTRAEVSDVANAVLDGTDAVMLSGETAAGKYPIRSVEVMAGVIAETEEYSGANFISGKKKSSNISDAIAASATQLAEKVGAVAIACMTASGATARAIASHRPSVPVYAFTDDQRVVGQVALTWGTKGFHIPFQSDTDDGISRLLAKLIEHDLATQGDLVVITAGMPLPAKGRSNTVHVSRI
jgi:pyruvate kinase